MMVVVVASKKTREAHKIRNKQGPVRGRRGPGRTPLSHVENKGVTSIFGRRGITT
jgi:hypothetical protein